MTKKFKIAKIESVSVKNAITGETYDTIDGEKFSAYEDLSKSVYAKGKKPKENKHGVTSASALLRHL